MWNPFSNTTTPATPAENTKEQQQLESDLRDTDQLLAKNETRSHQLAGYELSQEANELQSERVELMARRRILDRRLRELRGEFKPSPEQLTKQEEAERRREKYKRYAIAEQRESIENTIARFVAQGDHYNARLWRRQWLEIPRLVEAQLAD